MTTKIKDAILNLLTKHANTDGVRPTYSAMAVLLGVTGKIISNAVDELVVEGVISRSGRGSSTRIVFPDGRTLIQPKQIVTVEKRPVASSASKLKRFESALRKAGGFTDSPRACRPEPAFRMCRPETIVSRESHVGMAGNGHRGGVRTSR